MMRRQQTSLFLRSNSSRGSNNSSSNRRSSSSSYCSSPSSCPVLLSVLAWSVTFLLISSCLGIVDAIIPQGRLYKRSTSTDAGCKGVYDRSLFARLEHICEDCYNLFREPQLHSLCRENCFTSYYFEACMEALYMQDDIKEAQTWIKQLAGADPGIW